jgi:hypothetical protein
MSHASGFSAQSQRRNLKGKNKKWKLNALPKSSFQLAALRQHAVGQ